MFNFLMDSFQSVIIDWYSIQHALLNPMVKEQIRNRRLEQTKEYMRLWSTDTKRTNKLPI